MRIITGSAKGRRLMAPDTDKTRPATDRVREAVFSAIGQWVVDADVVDLYAGSGSYGLESLSRGAASATFVEKGRAAIEALRSNVETVGLGGTIIASDVETFLANPGRSSYDLAFIDPPWSLPTDALDGQLAALDQVMDGGGEVVVSRREGDRSPRIPSGWRVVTDRRYGDARIYRYRKETAQTKASEDDQ
ncbi:MAG: 16S rRNA (guanine(966)-N(2))-methyltransferase RsmD [Acidimicrobiia bacterium]